MSRSRYQNCFYYFRGPSGGSQKEAELDRQLEDNSTKALVNVLDHGGVDVTQSFIADLVGSAATASPAPQFFLQGGPASPAPERLLVGLSILGVIDEISWPSDELNEAGSRVDAAIHVPDSLTVFLETKVVDDLDGAQLLRHARKWRVPLAVRDPVTGWSPPPEWVFLTWPQIYRWAREQSTRYEGEIAGFLLTQLTEYMQLTGLAPMWSFRAEHFEYLTQAPGQRDAILKSEIKTRLRSLWAAVEQAVGTSAFKANLGEVRVGNLSGHDAHAFAQSNADRGSSFVNLTIELSVREVNINVVGWFDDQARLLLRWLRSRQGERFVETAPNFEIVVFVRTGTAGKKVVWQGAKGLEVARLPFRSLTHQAVVAEINRRTASLRMPMEKLGIHLRRSWPRQQVVDRDDLPEKLATEVQRLIPVLQEIRESP